jgi:tetratricopeptide (TPR) repeat protein
MTHSDTGRSTSPHHTAQVEPNAALLASAINHAWGALASGDHAEALSALSPYAQHTTTDQALAQVWAALLGGVEDERHLSYELTRLAGRWAEEAEVVLAIAGSAHAWASRHLTLAPPLNNAPLAPVEPPQGHERAALYTSELERAVWLGARVVSYCLEHKPPSSAEGRAALYLSRARLLCWGGGEAEEQALKDFEIVLSLDAHNAQAWYELARLHLNRGRWLKALLSVEQAQRCGLEAPQLTWLEVVARTALGGEHALSTPQLWSTLNHDELTLDVKGRAAKVGYEPQLVALTTHMCGVGGGYDLTQPWQIERVWVQPLSPCHGRLIHPPLSDFLAGYDDLIVWSPQPVAFEELQREGEEVDERPVMRALATLERGRAQSRPLLKPSLSAALLQKLNDRLPEGVFFYQAPHGPELQGVLCWPRGEPLAPLLPVFEELWAQEVEAHQL